LFADARKSLILSARHNAWLWATVKGAGTKRGMKWRDAGQWPPMPETTMPELFMSFMSAGPSMSGDMGEKPLTAQELMAWKQGTGTILSGWEFETILMLSQEYCAMKSQADSPACPAPWINYTDGMDKKKTAKDIKALLRNR
jgi:hypothetical protein